jgi:hypothetical protein
VSADPPESQPSEEGTPTVPGVGQPGALQPSSIDAIAPGPKVQAGFDPPTALVWFGVLGGALAWALAFLAGYGFGLAHCFPTGTSFALPVGAWQIAAAACAVAVALASMAVCVWIFLRTFRIGDVAGMERRGDGAPPPAGRLQSLAMMGITVNILALAIIVMAGVGAPILHVCQQS